MCSETQDGTIQIDVAVRLKSFQRQILTLKTCEGEICSRSFLRVVFQRYMKRFFARGGFNLATFQSRGWGEMAKIPAETGLRYGKVATDTNILDL